MMTTERTSGLFLLLAGTGVTGKMYSNSTVCLFDLEKNRLKHATIPIKLDDLAHPDTV